MTVCISRTKSLKELKEKMASLINKANSASNTTFKFEEKHFRLWKLGMNVTTTDIQNFLTSKLEEIKSDVASAVLYDIPDVSYLERNNYNYFKIKTFLRYN